MTGGKKHITLLIAFGPEVRAFLHSGLATHLAQHYDVSLITANPDSAVFTDGPTLPTQPLPAAQEPPLLRRWRGWARAARIGWLRAQGRQRWRHYLANMPQHQAQASNPLLTWLAGQGWFANGIGAAERQLARQTGTHPAWADLYHALGTDCLILASHNNPRTLPALQTARNLGLKTLIITNSWKDIYTSPHVAVPPDRFVVWTTRTADDLAAANPHLTRANIEVSSSLHMARFFDAAQHMDRATFCAQTGLDPDRPYLCYTAASPAAVINEEAIVRYILEASARGDFPEQPQVLLRINPMEDGTRFAELDAQYPDLIVQQPQWEWQKEREWNAALEVDVALWVATVAHAALNVSISSTVTMEFASLRRPVINICFDLPQDLPPAQTNRRFWDADFYAEVRASDYAIPATSGPELLGHIRRILAGEHEPRDPNSLFPDRAPVQTALRVVEEVLAE